jgi:hypothetical protein
MNNNSFRISKALSLSPLNLHMKNLAFKILSGVLVFAFFISCGTDQNKPHTPAASIQKDTVKKDTVKTEAVTAKPPRAINPELNDMARYIAGLSIAPGSKLDAALLKNDKWRNFSSILDQNWARVEKTKIGKMRPWVEKELSSLNTKSLFYPFAGADFLNAYTLFPQAKQYILVGLEPVGSPPDLMKIHKSDSLEFYFNTLNKSLSSILNFSFFRTKSMAVDFHQEDVNGTMQIMLLFIERTGHSIIDIKPVAVNSKGELVSYTSFEKAKRDTLRNHGAQIDFTGADSIERSVIYFSVNLANQPFIKNTGFKTFIKNQGADVTYIKSASYLMHKPYFSDIRSFIINNSRAILQDDSGIPWKFFNTNAYTISLYGTYTGTIPLFHNYQADLDSVYKKDSLKVKALPFGIGYKYKEGTSNLMLSIKK